MQHTSLDLAIIDLSERAPQSRLQTRTLCPECSATRKAHNRKVRSLSIRREEHPERIIYFCHHCSLNGIVTTEQQAPTHRAPTRRAPSPVREVAPPPKQVSGTLSERARKYLKRRGVEGAAIKLGVFSTKRWFRKVNGEVEGLAFPYRSDGGVEAVKYRCIDKKDFSCEGSPTSFWLAHRLSEGLKQILITEGELDALTFIESGFDSVVSVPNGASATVRSDTPPPREEDGGFNYFWHSHEEINTCPRIVLALDGDGPGKILGEELARRVGKAKCWYLEWPKNCKDANDVLLRHGKEILVKLVKEALPWPVAGLYGAKHYEGSLLDIYTKGVGKGESTGIACVDELMTIVPGQVSVVTGVPSSGKSEFIDQIMVNLAVQSGWSSAVASFENPPEFHLIKLLEKYIGKPFHQGDTQRMTEEEINESMTWINDHFVFIDQSDGEPCHLTSILERARAAVQRLGVRVLVIDPYNYITREDQRGSNETDQISHMLTQVKNFAKGHDVHVFFVAHPAKLRRDDKGRSPIPMGYDISGSAAWFSKADMGVTIDRNDDGSSDVHVWKCRFKWVGKQGVTTIKYDTVTGTYTEGVDWDAEYRALGGEPGQVVYSAMNTEEPVAPDPWWND